MKMKYLLIPAILMMLISSVYASDSNAKPFSGIDAGDRLDDITVDFEFKDKVIGGFTASDQGLSDTSLALPEFLVPGEDGTLNGFAMTPDADFSEYSTENFYYYVQILSDSRVRIDYSITPLQGGSDSIPFTVEIRHRGEEAVKPISVENSTVSSEGSDSPLINTTAVRPVIDWWEFRAYFTRQDFFSKDRTNPRYESTITIIIDGGNA